MSKEAMKLALEALNENYNLINGTDNKFGLEGAMDGYYRGCFDVEGTNKKTKQTIKALEEALAKQEQGEPVSMPPVNCRQRLKAEGKVYARSNCQVCGAFAPKWKECDAALSSTCQHVLDEKQEHGEPVAWMHLKAYGYAPGGYMMTCRGCNNQVIDVDKRASRCRTCAEAAYTKDTTPQQRTWVGLTDVEWMNIVNKDQAWFGQRPDEVAHEVAKLVEAKLKEKNNG